MPSPNILLCHASDWVAHEMQAAVYKADPTAICHSAWDLTEAYNFIEHQQPACLVVAAELVTKPEFELLGALLRQMRVGCVVWGSLGENPLPASPPNLQLRSGQMSTAAFQKLLIAAVDPANPSPNPSAKIENRPVNDPNQLILIGASTGGIDALTRVLAHFSPLAPATMIVQHTGGRFAPSLIRLLDRATSATVMAAHHGQQLQRGHVYLSPDDAAHIRLSKTKKRVIALDESAAVSGHRPSVDVLFHSAVAQAPHVSAALLTGMGKDGAQGLKALRDAGAQTIVQDKATCVVYGMPRIAADMGAAMAQLPIDAIGPRLLGTSVTRAIA